MIDDDDVLIAAVAWPDGGPGWFGCFFALLGIAVVIVLAIVASQNEAECSSRKCATGTARLLDGECVCATTPKAGSDR